MNARFELIDGRIDAPFEAVDARFEAVQTRMGARFDHLDRDVAALTKRIFGSDQS